MSKVSLRDDIEPNIGLTSLGSYIQQYSLGMPGMHAGHLKFRKYVLYNVILQRIIQYYSAPMSPLDLRNQQSRSGRATRRPVICQLGRCEINQRCHRVHHRPSFGRISSLLQRGLWEVTSFSLHYFIGIDGIGCQVVHTWTFY